MCRLLAVLSPRPVSAFAPLLETDRSLWRQSFARRDQLQRDGWGLAWYPRARAQGRAPAGGRCRPRARPRVLKSPGPLPDQREVLRRAAGRAVGTRLVFHLRRASNPRGLPLARLRGRRNLQPFSFGRWTFAHNGTIPFPVEAARRLGAFRRRLRGLNDSEVLFWLLMKELRSGRGVPAAIRAVRRVLKEAARGAAFHRGLNIILCDGETLWAYSEPPAQAGGDRNRPEAGMAAARGRGKPLPGSLMSRGWPYWRLAFLPAAAGFWVASEPVWSGTPWKGLAPGELLEARERGGKIAWKKRQLLRR